MSEPAHEPSRHPHHEPPATAAAEEELLAALADDFAARARRNERPSVEEYVAKHPALAERIRKVLQAIAWIEESGTVDLGTAGEGPGATIGRYKLLERIGEGGFGVVYMAEQHHPVRRRVALKVVKPGMDSRQVLARFEAERQALAIMDHPNIAKVFDGGMTDSGRLYFVMELVKGEPITEFCDRTQLPPRQRLELFAQVCHAVQHAHIKGVIHRDIKPSNVLVAVYDTTPVVKVIDFGVAKALGQELTDKTLFTGFAQLLGTPLYMSPEQAGQSALDVDTRSDVYSLGVLLYELLTGTTPFDKERFRKAAQDEIRRIIREEEPPRPSTRLSDSKASLPSISAQRHTEPAKLTRLVRGELDWIVMKALEKDRTRRYETANGFAKDIQRYLAGEAVQAVPPSAAYRLRKFTRRNKGPVLTASLVLLALVGGIVGITWGMIRATGAEAVAVRQSVKTQAALEDAKNQLFLSLWSQARAGRFSRQTGQRRDSLAALVQAARIRPDERLRDEAIAAMALPDVHRVPGWRSAPLGTSSMAYGGQYRLYARTDNRGTISIRSIPDDREIRRIESGTIIDNNLYVSPDERFVLGFGGGRILRVWRVADGQPALQVQPDNSRAPAFSADGRHLAVCWQEWVLCFDLASGREVKRWHLGATARTLAFHPDNRKLAVGHFGRDVASVYDAASGALLTELPVGAIRDQVVAWHPDGERLAVAGADGRIQIWNVAAKRKVATLDGHVQTISALTFHPEGNLLASHSWDGDLRLWEPATGRPLLRLPLAVGDTPRFSGDGRWLGAALHGEQADLLEVTPNREYRTLVSSLGTDAGAPNFCDISPDGRRLAVGMDDGARLWDLDSCRELSSLPAGTIYVFFDGCRNPASTPRGGRPATAGGPSALLTGGSDGLLRWPVTSDSPEGTSLTLGPPQQLSPERRAHFARTPDGGTLAVVTKQDRSSKVLDLEAGTERDLGSHPDGEIRALSADGQWAASSGWHSVLARLWNVRTGQMVHEWVVGNQTHVYFTPDSRTLIISRGDEFSFWDVQTFQPILRLRRDVAVFPGHVGFSPDGKLMALEMTPAVIHLKDVATGRTVAKLEDPHGDRATWQGFTPDGARLVVVSSYARAIHVWDLRAIRARLKDMSLDWDWPEFPPAVTGTRPAEAAELLEVDPKNRQVP